MTYSLNKVMLIGRVGQDPETRFSNNNSPITSFSIATTSRWRDRQTQEMQEDTQWHNVVCFGRTAEIASEYLKKGQQCFVEGTLQNQSWERDGVRHYRTEVRVRDLILLGGNGGGGSRSSYGGGSERSEGSYGRSSHNTGYDSGRPSEKGPQKIGGEHKSEPSTNLTQDKIDDDIPF